MSFILIGPNYIIHSNIIDYENCYKLYIDSEQEKLLTDKNVNCISLLKLISIFNVPLNVYNRNQLINYTVKEVSHL
jgi:hypothetical protein